MRSSIGTYSTVCTARLTSVKVLLDAFIKEAVMVYLHKEKVQMMVVLVLHQRQSNSLCWAKCFRVCCYFLLDAL